MLPSPKSSGRLLFYLALAFFCISCAAAPVQADVSQPVRLADGESLGQTFVAEYDGLDEVQLYLTPQGAGYGSLVLSLRADPGSSEDLATARLPLAEITAPGFYTLEFTPQRSSAREYYYAQVVIDGQAQVVLGAGSGSAYQQGAMYRDQQPLDGQLGFALGYQPGYQALGLAREAAWGAGLLLVGSFLFLLPGWGLLSWALPGWKRLPLGARLGLAGGTSLAVYPLLLLAADLTHLRLGGWLAWLPAMGGMVLWVFSRRGSSPDAAGGDAPVPADRAADLVFLLVLVLVMFSRLASVRTLEAPMWGDSLQHTMVTQLLLDHGGLFDSWQPYAEAATFTYHFGFHAAASALAWLTRLPADRAVLWTGQLLNILAVLSLYPLALQLSRNRWAGTVAVLVGGLLAQMPMFYTNWGRYPQLAGQVVLPALVFVAWEYLEGKLPQRALLAGWLLLAGLALTHYRILVLAVLFLITWLVVRVKEGGTSAAVRFFTLVLGSGILFLPWFLHVYEGAILRILTGYLRTPPSAAANANNAIGDISFYLPAWLWFLALAALIAGTIVARFKGRWVWVFWMVLTLLLANPGWLGLPGAGAVNNFTVFLAAYIPASIWIGAGAGWALDREVKSWRFVWIGLLVVLSLKGTVDRLADIQPDQFSLLTRPDQRAAVWIDKSLPEEAHFLINSFPAFGSSQVGSDGGWWLPLTSGRMVNIPPLSHGFEGEVEPGDRESASALTDLIQQAGIGSPGVGDILREKGITHVYVGQYQGTSNSPFSLLDIDDLAGSELFNVVYHQDRVWIFEIRY